MEKQLVRDVIAKGTSYLNEFTFGYIKTEMEKGGYTLEDTDIIESRFDDGYQSSDSGMDPHYFFSVTRIRPETDTEFDNRKARAAKAKEDNKKHKYETYLKLKRNSMRNYNTKVTEMDEDGYGAELHTIDEWKETLKWGWINEYDGSAYWVKDGMESIDSAFHTEQEDATHVAFYGN